MDRRLLLKSCAAGAAATILTQPAVAGGPGQTPNYDMIRALGAPGRKRSRDEDEQAAAFDQFVGTWNVAYTNIAPDGKREAATGQLLVGWVLDGRGLQDIWTQEAADPASPRFMGTTIRFYDATKKTWRVTWVAPIAQAVTMLEGRRTGNTIVLLADLPKGLLRWSFHDIEDSRFNWRGELSTDRGQTWRLREDHIMTRAGGS